MLSNLPKTSAAAFEGAEINIWAVEYFKIAATSSTKVRVFPVPAGPKIMKG